VIRIRRSTFRTLLVSVILAAAALVMAACDLSGTDLGGAAGGQLSCQRGNPDRLDCSSLSVSGVCRADGTAEFTITNTGDAGEGDMRQPTEYRIYVDDVLVETGQVQLNGGASMTVTYSAAGDIRLEADQQVGHPGSSLPRETLSCGGVPPTHTAEPPTQTPVPPTTTPLPPTSTPVPPTATPRSGQLRITLCHATGSATNPYVEITVSYNAVDGHGHEGHTGDIIPAPAGGCPQPTSPPTATRQPPREQITLCHATGSATNPYVLITVSYNAVDGHGHEGHAEDIIPAPADGCPKPPPPPVTSTPRPTETPRPPRERITLCHATGSATNPYVEITVSYNAVDGHGHEDHANDIIPMPAGGCPRPPTPTVPPPPQRITLCHATGSATNPYVEITVNYNAVDGHGHEGHAFDIIPMPAEGCPRPSATPTPSPTPTLPPTPTPTAPPTATPTLPPSTPPPPPPTEVIVPPAPPVALTCPQWLLFHTFRDENLEIYRLDGVEGVTGQLINLTNSPFVDSRPSRSPDDSLIVFETDRHGNIELYLADTEGINQWRLTTTSSNNVNPMFGPDNQTVIFQSDRNGNWDIFSINIVTEETRQLTSDPHDDAHPYWSPSMRYVTYESNRTGSWDLYILDTNTGEEFQLTHDVAVESFPLWSPNGRQIAFLSDKDGNLDLYVVNADGTDLRQITSGLGDTNNASWSPEGHRLAYQDERDGNLDVYTYDLRADEEYRLTEYEGVDSAPTWDCGGSRIAFTSMRDGNPNLFQVFWQGGPQSNLTIDPATDKWSQWSPSKEVGSRGY
jgi:TolB protein